MQPPTFDPVISFADEESNSVGGRSTVRTSMLDTIFSAIKSSINALVSNLGLIQRDDGALVDGIVTTAALSSDLRQLIGNWNPKGAWMTATGYSARDMVTNAGTTYVAVSAHTAGTFSTDLAAGKWMAVSPTILDASAVTFSPTGGLSSTTAQGAIAELDSELRAAATLYTYRTLGGF